MALPLVFNLPDNFRMTAAFDRLAHRRGVLWLDSASQNTQTGRYSYLTSDPLQLLLAYPDQPSPWSQLEEWETALPQDLLPDLPPFQGGLAGVWGYESAQWLEPILRSTRQLQTNDFLAPDLAVGVYDWVIAQDHILGKSWLVTQGFGCLDDSPLPESERIERARQRQTQVLGWLKTPIIYRPENRSPANASSLAKQFPTSRHPRLTSSFSSQGYREAVAGIVQSIRKGKTFQVNLSQRLLCDARVPSNDLYRRLRQANPAPMAGYFDAGPCQILSSSPEGFLSVHQRHVETRPIKGTVPRTGDATKDEALANQLRKSTKDIAENVMIVDLMRNDLARVCEDDSICVQKLCQIEPYQFVQHLVSVVQGKLRPDVLVMQLIAASFPGGSITGAPKIESMLEIAAYESTPRGAYCGSMGFVGCGGVAELNILIRTITAMDGWWQIPVGGGITAQSDPAAEEQETWDKAEGMLRAILQAK